MLLYCYLVKYDMLIKIKVSKIAPQSDLGKHVDHQQCIKLKCKVFYDDVNDTYVKRFNFFNKVVYDRITTLVPTAYPGNLLDHSCTKDSMQFVWKEQAGNILSYNDWDNNETIQKVRDFLVKDLERTYPIVHNDWCRTNLLFKDSEPHALIDFDKICIVSSKQQALRTLNKHILNKTFRISTKKCCKEKGCWCLNL